MSNWMHVAGIVRDAGYKTGEELRKEMEKGKPVWTWTENNIAIYSFEPLPPSGGWHFVHLIITGNLRGLEAEDIPDVKKWFISACRRIFPNQAVLSVEVDTGERETIAWSAGNGLEEDDR